MKRAYTIAVVSMLGGLLVHMMVLLVIKVEMPAPKRPAARPAAVKYIGDLVEAGSGPVIEQADLSDSAPLFMPTSWNSASNLTQVASLQSATRIFEPFPPELALTGTSPVMPSAAVNAGSGQPLRLPTGPAFYMARFGREVPRQITAVSPGPTLRIANIQSGGQDSADGDVVPVTLAETAPQSLWNPVKMFLQIQNGIPVGLPLLSQSSGFADWDAALQRYFASLEFYRQLDDGYFQIWVYP